MDGQHEGRLGSATRVRERIEQGGERLWRFEDFRDLPSMAVAQALSRLARAGAIERLSKGTYYRSRDTAFGKSRPNPALVRSLAARRKSMFPAGVAAANALGFTTQTPGKTEVSTNAASLPRKLVGADTVVHTRRPEAWSTLHEKDAALLEFLRSGGATSEFPPSETVEHTLALLRERGRLRRLLAVASMEPPRVRAMLGAIGEELEVGKQALAALRATLNPSSRFDFGAFSVLPRANSWQAKGAAA